MGYNEFILIVNAASIIILLVMAAAVFGVDYLLRRKKWKDNSKEEKISLLVNMFSVGPYLFLSAVSMLWGIASTSPDTDFGLTLYHATLTMASVFFVIAGAAVILSLIFRKMGKLKASIWVNIIAVLYIVIVLFANNLISHLM